MLQEILSQMTIDPELLEQLSEESKQILFKKIREEQVRRWEQKEKELDKKPAKKPTRKINFNMGADGSPWVWVMGEHKDDLSYKELIRRREQEDIEKERQRELQDRKEAAELAKQERLGIQSLGRVFVAIGKFRRPLKRGSGVDVTDGPSPLPPPGNPHLGVARTESQMGAFESPMPNRRGGNQKEEEEERERTMEKKATIIGVTDEEQSQFEKKRTEEVFVSLQRARTISKRRAADVAQNLESWWQESMKKGKEFDRVRKRSFKKVLELSAKSPDILESIPVEKQKEIFRRMTLERKPRKPVRPAPTGPPSSRGPSDRAFKKQSSFIKPGTVPKSTSHVTSWFNKNEAPKGVGREKDGSISIWFHGKLNREASARLLEMKPVGSFLVRLSSKIWGYTVSVKTYTACKHFLVDTTSGQYCFVGPKQQKFHSLVNLIKFYRANPVTWSGQEVLLIPVGQEEENWELYRGLYNDEGLSEEILSELAMDYQGSTL